MMNKLLKLAIGVIGIVSVSLAYASQYSITISNSSMDYDAIVEIAGTCVDVCLPVTLQNGGVVPKHTGGEVATYEAHKGSSGMVKLKVFLDSTSNQYSLFTYTYSGTVVKTLKVEDEMTVNGASSGMRLVPIAPSQVRQEGPGNIILGIVEPDSDS